MNSWTERESKSRSQETEVRRRVIAKLFIINSDFRHGASRIRSLISSHSSFILLLIFASLFSINCSRSTLTNNQAVSPEITVAAAANLTDAFTEMEKEFTSRTGVRVRLSFGATADLARQIENGAPFDVFAAADVEHVDKLNSEGLLMPGTNHLFARGRLVLWIPPNSSFTLNRIEDIARPEVERIALAKPDIAPYGRAAVEALHALNLWTQIEPKVIYGQSVAQAKQYAATGYAEVAFIPLSLFKPNEGQAIEVDERLHRPLNHAIAVIKDSHQQEAAQRFVTFVLSPEGQAMLERYGYIRAVTGDK
ncbi:MAG: molybdate transport system substrate-binding protein [Acidobacteriota bacterium]|jgi:molybdate transport system substrate-binding protein|nr:molybdate transport system substrate-binding protein [Acidobacteriota bacterium]